MSALFASLPAPTNAAESREESEKPVEETTTVARVSTVPPYGKRRNWRPKVPSDFGDGGSYPECHVAQYPLELGRKRATAGTTLALQVDAAGNVQYDAIAKYGHKEGTKVQTKYSDLVPLAQRDDLKDKSLERPSEEEVMSTTERTKAALEKLVSSKIKASQPKNVPTGKGDVSYVRYTSNQGGGDKQRIIKMMDVVEDPLEPPKFKGKKIPRGPPSPPPPVLRSPPRKVTAQDQKEWMIPPSVSNWKNNKGYTIPLDKRLAADGRGLQEIGINDRFAQLSEALYIADRHAREEVRERALLQQRIAEKEKEDKEETLRLLAQRAREERSGIARPAEEPRALVSGYGSGSESEAESEGAGRAARRVSRSRSRSLSPASDASGESRASSRVSGGSDDSAAAARDRIRRERRAERQRELRMSHMGNEQRARVLARAQGRDISEKVALGLAKPTASKDAMLDSRLFNREQLNAGFGDDESYDLYDKPLFTGAGAAAAIYAPRGGNASNDGEIEEGMKDAMRNDRFGLGESKFAGADKAPAKEGPVEFEKDETIAAIDPFGVDAFLEQAQGGDKSKKRGLETKDDRDEEKANRKRAKDFLDE